MVAFAGERRNITERSYTRQRSVSGWEDAECGVEFAGKILQAGDNFGRLFNHGGEDASGGIRFGANQFGGCEDEGKVVIDVVARGCELLVKCGNCLRTEGETLFGHRHESRWAKAASEGKRLRVSTPNQDGFRL